MASWCPRCRAEWWADVAGCPECGDALVDELPPEAARTDRPGQLDHHLFEYELGDLSDSDRWQVGLLLRAEGIAHEWRGSTLRAPSQAATVVERVAERSESSGPDDAPSVAGPGGEPDVPATVPRRLAAAFVDAVIVYLFVGAISIAWHTTTVEDGVRTLRPTAGALAVALILRAAYDIVGVGRWGRTPGKALARMRVVAAAGGPAGWRRSLMRFVVTDLGWMFGWLVPSSWSIVASWLALAYLVAIYTPLIVDPLHRGLHDRAAGTVVVQESSGRRPPGVIPAERRAR